MVAETLLLRQTAVCKVSVMMFNFNICQSHTYKIKILLDIIKSFGYRSHSGPGHLKCFVSMITLYMERQHILKGFVNNCSQE